MENQRRWEDLNKDCLANVFERVGVESLLLNVPFVCNSWHKASLNPSCWQCLIFPDNDTSPDGFDLQAQDFQSRDKLPTDIFGTFMNKFQNKYQIDGNRFSLNAFLKFVINRSRGRATFLRLPADCTHEALEYVANVCPSLEALSLPRYLVHQVRSTLPGLIEKWKHLELLSRGSSGDLVKTLSEISIHCKNFRRLHVSYAYIGNDEALHIVKLVPNIKHLSLRKAYIEQENLVTLIQGCKELVVWMSVVAEVSTRVMNKSISMLLILPILGVMVRSILILVLILMITTRENLPIFLSMNLIN